MRRMFDFAWRRRYLTVLVAAASVAAVYGAAGALADVEVTHGISVTKGCVSPVKIGDAYSCSFTIRNITDDAEDTLTIDSIVDVVHAFPQPGAGDVDSGNILSSSKLELLNGATCVGGSGAGTAASPYVGATQCTLPFGARI